MMSSSSSRVSEIEEDEWYSRSEELFEIKHLESIKEDEDVVYVALVGQMSSSSHDMDALVWTLNHLVDPFSCPLVNLIHVFPQIHYIPTPLGKLPISQVNPEQKERYMIQERGKRRDFLEKFLDICSVSKVKVETILIESDMEAKALLDLIPILYMKKLVLGTPKSGIRKLRSGKGNETVDEVVQNVPEFCELHENKWCLRSKHLNHLLQESPRTLILLRVITMFLKTSWKIRFRTTAPLHAVVLHLKQEHDYIQSGSFSMGLIGRRSLLNV